MSLTSAEPPLVPLRLSSREQWVLHHVLSTRIERSRRHRGTVPTPPQEVGQALRKVESGSLLFTVPELRRAREALTAHLRREATTPGERREVGNLVDRVDRALATSRSPRPR